LDVYCTVSFWVSPSQDPTAETARSLVEAGEDSAELSGEDDDRR
jgi:hypothetical protein